MNPPTSKETAVKTMTCRQLGGPCEHAHQGDSADNIIKAQDAHLKQAVDAGDSSHEAARSDMKGRWRHPKKAMDWYGSAKKQFAELPDDVPAA